MSWPHGRGRGESLTLADADIDNLSRKRKISRTKPSSQLQLMDVDPNCSGSSSEGEELIRGRAGFRCRELCTIPASQNPDSLKADSKAPGQPIQVLSNFIKIKPMSDRNIYSYRVDFEPNLESVSLRRRLLRQATKDVLGSDLLFDGASEARSSLITKEVVSDYYTQHPDDPKINYKIILKRTGVVSPGSFELLRVYNMHMKRCLEALGFFQVSASGSYVHPALATPIGTSNTIVAARGYKTSVNMHETGEILMKLDSCHKLIQRNNVLQNMVEIRSMSGNPRENLKSMLTGKLVVTSYNKIVYRVEDINFGLSPKSGFKDKKTGKDITFIEYFKNRYNVTIQDHNQPLLLVVQNNKRFQKEQQGESREIYVVPELCNIAGLTEAQRNDNRLKTDLIRASQISPNDRVKQMETLIRKLTDSPLVHQVLNKWGYKYDKEPVEIKGRVLPIESIGLGKVAGDKKNWPKADALTGGFEREVMRESLAQAPELKNWAILMPRIHSDHRNCILNRLRQGMQMIGLICSAPKIIDLPGDSTQNYITMIRSMPGDVSIVIAVLQHQNKDRYDGIKKLATVNRGLVTQVVTVKLLLDEKKAGGAVKKIGIQIAAKIGGEPWYVDIPTRGDMICGYDTYHDTTDRSKSYGAFIASSNEKFSRWFSKADSHGKLDELSSHMATNLLAALEHFKKSNQGKYPRRIFMYRDGVSDGQLEHVYNVELKHVIKAIESLQIQTNDDQPPVKPRLTFTVVNKSIGAQFYMRQGGRIENPVPGTVIDNTVTRKERYDFYLISQSTRHGTVAPTYYNIIYDESSLDAAKHQMLAYKLCFLYYNWTGTVRVPAPCQYAHKLALLCGEHLHAIPNTNLDDRLHFL